MKLHSQQIAETEPEHPHGDDGEDHGPFTSAAARSVFGSVKDSGQIVTTQAAWYRMMSFVYIAASSERL